MAELNKAVKYLIIGGGLTGATAALKIREIDPEGSLLIVSGENHPPYNRPPLSKEYLRGESGFDDALVAPEKDYDAERIALRLGITAEKADLNRRIVTLGDGTAITFEKLLIATGARPKPLDSAKTPGANAGNIFYLRTVDDSDSIRSKFAGAIRVVIIGAGYIGMETAADAAQHGIEVTVITPDDRPWAKFTSLETGDFMRRVYEKHGVCFVFGERAAEFVTDPQDRVTAVQTTSGLTLPCDFVIAGVGAALNLDLAKSAGLKVDDKEGVSVDSYLETGVPGVFVAGDIANFQDPVLNKQWHIEHWQNAEWQGQVAGANMAGRRAPYDHVPYFFSDFFDLHMTLRGDSQAGKTSFVIGSTATDTDRFLELYLREDGTLAQGLLLSKQQDETAASDLLEKLIRARIDLRDYQEALQSEQIKLESLG